MNNYTAIQMEKIKFNDKGIYIYKPIGVVEGDLFRTKDGTIFLDDTGKKYPIINKLEMNDENAKTGVGFFIKNDALLNQCNEIDLTKAQDKYFELCKSLLNIGFSMPEFNKIEITSVNIKDLYKQLYNMNIIKANPKLLDTIDNNAQNDEEDNELDTSWIAEYVLLVIEDMLKVSSLSKIKEMLNELAEELESCIEEYSRDPRAIETKKVDENKMEKKTQKYYDEMSFDNQQVDYETFDYQKTYNYMTSRIIDRNEQIGKILSTIKKVDYANSKGDSKKPALLIAGTTGTGKTQTYLELEKALEDRPLIIVDTNQLTQEGYVGGTLEKNILTPLLLKSADIAYKDLPAESRGKLPVNTPKVMDIAKRGIIILDEIDKRADKGGNGDKNVNGGAVIDQLLKLMEKNTYTVSIGREVITFNSGDLVVFASGAFQEYFDDLEKPKFKEKHMGFATVQEPVNKKSDFKDFYEVNPEDLAKYGLSSQFIGRFNSIVLYPPHTIESLTKLERNESTSNINRVSNYFKDELGIDVVYDDELITEMAKEAITLKMGGRALGNIVNRCISKIENQLNMQKGEYDILYIPVSAIKDPETVVLRKKTGELVYAKELMKKNNENVDELQKIKFISCNQDKLASIKKSLKMSLNKEQKYLNKVDELEKTKIKK